MRFPEGGDYQRLGESEKCVFLVLNQTWPLMLDLLRLIVRSGTTAKASDVSEEDVYECFA